MNVQQSRFSLDHLLACALAIEQDAADRYSELADQMEVHNNPDVAELFGKLAAIEAKHVANVLVKSEGRRLPTLNPLEPLTQETGSLEAVPYDELHYMMTPFHALSLALAGERRAAGFFARLAEEAEDAEVRRIAAVLRDEEREHVTLLEDWLGRYPEPDADWHEDHDPPAAHE